MADAGQQPFRAQPGVPRSARGLSDVGAFTLVANPDRGVPADDGRHGFFLAQAIPASAAAAGAAKEIRGFCDAQGSHSTRSSPGSLADEPASDEDWDENLRLIDDRMCLVLTHAGKLFTIFEPDVRVDGLRDTGRLVTGLIGRELAPEGLGRGECHSRQDRQPHHPRVHEDMAFAGAHAVDLAGGFANADIGAINQRLPRNVLSARGYQKPIELTMPCAETAWQTGRVDR